MKWDGGSYTEILINQSVIEGLKNELKSSLLFSIKEILTIKSFCE